MTAARILSPLGACTAAALRMMLSQQPRKTPSTQPGGIVAKTAAVADVTNDAMLSVQPRGGEKASAKPVAIHSNAAARTPSLKFGLPCK
jgi:hypothetical protein